MWLFKNLDKDIEKIFCAEEINLPSKIHIPSKWEHVPADFIESMIQRKARVHLFHHL